MAPPPDSIASRLARLLDALFGVTDVAVEEPVAHVLLPFFEGFCETGRPSYAGLPARRWYTGTRAFPDYLAVLSGPRVLRMTWEGCKRVAKHRCRADLVAVQVEHAGVHVRFACRGGRGVAVAVPADVAVHRERFRRQAAVDVFVHPDLGPALDDALDRLLGALLLDHDLDPAVAREARLVGRALCARVAAMEADRAREFSAPPRIRRSDWVFSRDRVPAALWPEVLANPRQVARWEELFGAVEDDPHLPVETALFDADFTRRLLAAGACTEDASVVVQGANLPALRLLGPRLADGVDVAYFDPPYNTTDIGFHYRNAWARSTWLTMVAQAAEATRPMLAPHGLLAVAIDDAELYSLVPALDTTWGEDHRVGTLVVEIKPSGRTNDRFLSTSHEYCLWYARDPARVDIAFWDLDDRARAVYTEQDGQGAYRWRDFLRTGGLSTPAERPNSYYPIYHRPDDGYAGVDPVPGAVRVLPLDSTGRERIWRKTPPSFLAHVRAGDIRVHRTRGGTWKVHIKDRVKRGVRPRSVWTGARLDAATHGTKLLQAMFGAANRFTYPKSLHAVSDVIGLTVKDRPQAVVLDPFAGSGTTGHAVIGLNRRDCGARRFVLVEVGPHFDTVLLPRLLKAAWAEDWKDGRPVARASVSLCLEVLRLDDGTGRDSAGE